jgi:hypothetical protein
MGTSGILIYINTHNPFYCNPRFDKHFFWSSRSGQMDDIEGPKYRMLFDDEDDLNRKEKN